MDDKKPDGIVDGAALLPYASNVGAPVIKPVDISSWKFSKILKTNEYFEAKYNELVEEYKTLLEQYEWNEIVYASDFKFEPIKGKIYHLYQRDTGEMFLSLIEPHLWDKVFIGSFKLDTNDKWVKIN
jgi:hypothetical protein